MNKALDDVRAAESRKMAQEGHPPLLKKSRWCVLKRKRISPRSRIPSARSAPLQPPDRPCLSPQRRFSAVLGIHSPTWAGMFLIFGAIKPAKPYRADEEIARTLRAHRTLLLNYFKARKQFSSGVIEGLNNKAKVTMRRSYGFRTFRILELALYHSLGKLPEPELTMNSSDESFL